VSTHNKFDVAASQLESAIGLYVSNTDRLSAITLAGAADAILCQLVLDAGKENFTDYMARVATEQTGVTPTRAETGKSINDQLMINALKHMDEGDAEYLDLDVDDCGLAAILKAVANWVHLKGRGAPVIEAFLLWVQLNIDPSRLGQPDFASKVPSLGSVVAYGAP
jgi:hypothetical protein